MQIITACFQDVPNHVTRDHTLMRHNRTQIESQIQLQSCRAPVNAARAPRAFRNPAFRRYSSEAAPKQSNTALFAGLAALTAAGGIGYYVYASESNTAKEAGTAIKSGVQSAKAATKLVPTKEDYQKVRSCIMIAAATRD